MNAAAKPRLRVVGAPAKADPIFGARPRHELEFLPAALEVIETPPPPLPRITALVLVALLIGALAWACLSKVDVVSTAPGRLVPTGGGKVVQPLEAGTVTAIDVHDGAFVHKGDVLVELEPTETLADQQRLAGELAAARLEVARLSTVALGAPFHAPPGTDPTAAAIAERSARAAIEDRDAHVQGLAAQVRQHQAELVSEQAEVDRLATLAPLADQRAQMFESLDAQGFGSKLQLLEAQEKQQDTAHTLEVQRQKIPAVQASIASSERERVQAEADAAKTDLAALTDAQVKANSLADDLEKAVERQKDRTLTAPVDGTVQELAIHTIGGVVEPGQTLMRIAPADVGVEVEAKLSNKDVGFVRAGMPAEIKVETFPFTRYGVINARVESVSSDAVAEQPPSTSTASAQSTQDAADLHYLVYLRLSRDTINVDGKLMRLTPGMMVDAEIKTGRRRVIEYVLSPVKKATSEAGRER